MPEDWQVRDARGADAVAAPGGGKHVTFGALARTACTGELAGWRVDACAFLSGEFALVTRATDAADGVDTRRLYFIRVEIFAAGFAKNTQMALVVETDAPGNKGWSGSLSSVDAGETDGVCVVSGFDKIELSVHEAFVASATCKVEGVSVYDDGCGGDAHGLWRENGQAVLGKGNGVCQFCWMERSNAVHFFFNMDTALLFIQIRILYVPVK